MFGTGSAQDTTFVKDSTIQTFQKDVLDASMKKPVLVDFWADWCEPCKQLTPTLEKITKSMGGKVLLVKVNAGKEKELAAQLKIQSLPTVMAFKGGQPVDGFAGAVPESDIKALIVRLLEGDAGNQIEQFMEMGKAALEAKDFGSAIQAFGQIAQSDPTNSDALGLLAKAYIANSNIEEAKQILATVPPTDINNEAVKSARTSLELMEDAEGAGDISKAEKLAFENPENLEAQFNFALALVGNTQLEKAGDILIKIILSEPGWNDEAARKQLLKLFEVAGHMDPFTLKYRRKLSSILFS